MIRIQELSVEEGRVHLSRFMPPHFTDATVDLRGRPGLRLSCHNHGPAGTGSGPVSFAQWAREHAADFG
jgi:hypothetical protein